MNASTDGIRWLFLTVRWSLWLCLLRVASPQALVSKWPKWYDQRQRGAAQAGLEAALLALAMERLVPVRVRTCALSMMHPLISVTVVGRCKLRWPWSSRRTFLHSFLLVRSVRLFARTRAALFCFVA